MLRMLFGKLVQGLATAVGAVAIADLAVTTLCALEGSFNNFGVDAALRVGLPAFVVGVLFFPVNEKTLASRWGFALRAGLAATASGLVHRSLLWAYEQTASADSVPDGWAQTLKVELSEATTALLHPSVLLPTTPYEHTLLLALAAIAGVSVLGFATQPALLSLARSLRGARVRPQLGPLDSTGTRDPRHSISS